jgi:outer membrane biosynthesis protein TonB
VRWDWTISACCHAAVLVTAVVSFAPMTLPIPQPQSIAVNIVSDSDKSSLTRGVENAPQKDKPNPLVEEVGEQRPVENPNAKVVPKREITAATDAPPPLPTPKAAPKKKSEPKRDQIAEAIKEDARQPQPKKTEAKAAPLPPKRPPQPKQEYKFDPNQTAALLDKRAPQRMAATGDVINDTIAQGAPRGAATQLSQSELDALRARLRQLWNPPVGAGNQQELVVLVRMQLKRDRTLAARPIITSRGTSPTAIAAGEAAVRAIISGQPFTMLRDETYEQWSDIEVEFDPITMIRG